MKTLSTLILSAALAAAGCMGTTGPQGYEADAPLAIEKSPRAEKADRPAADPGSAGLPAANDRVSADEIDDSNVQESLRRLESDLKQDRRAVSKAGR